MTRILSILVIIFFSNISLAEISNETRNKYFYIGKMKSYNNKFTLYFKTRDKAILARGEETNYINDFPQDLYIYNHNSKEDLPLLTYDWFPKKVKKLVKNYSYPVFPEDFAYYLMKDNNTLIKEDVDSKITSSKSWNIFHLFFNMTYQITKTGCCKSLVLWIKHLSICCHECAIGVII